MHLKFVDTESTYSYAMTTKEYLLKHGRPICFYSDKHGVFRVNAKHENLTGKGITHFSESLQTLNISIICANSSQAKGRVERANKTLQDRLVKEMRLRNISSIEEGNNFLPDFVAIHNCKFAKIPESSENAHMTLEKSSDELDYIFAWKEDRSVTKNLTIQYDKVMYLIEDSVQNRRLRKNRVTVVDYYDGRIEIFSGDRKLEYKIFFDKVAKITQGAISDNKRLGAVLAYIQENKDPNGYFENRSQDSPTRPHLKINDVRTKVKQAIS
jgi:hypothetical protein